MKALKFFKEPAVIFFAVTAVLFFLPYTAPLIFLNDYLEWEWEFWAIRGIFALAGSLLLTMIACLLKKPLIRGMVEAPLWMLLELLILFESSMLCFTGNSFDQAFLMHFNLDALSEEVISAFWKPVTVILLVFFLLCALLVWLSCRIDPETHFRKLPGKYLLPVRSVLAAGAIGLFFLPETPLSMLITAMEENLNAARDFEYFSTLASHPDAVGVDQIVARPGKNLVFIIVESLEQNYLSEKHFPNLLPNIEKWMKKDNALVFENMRSAPINTFDFLYQSHIGNYMYSIFASAYADRQPSLSQILWKAGYNTSFLKACTLDFASTGDFVEKIRYEKRMDWRTPEVQKQASELGEWGFRDYDLFEIAKNEFDKLAAQKKPFAFTLFTVDSHAPNGVIGKNSLKYNDGPYASRFSLLSALHTTDKALGKFLEHIANSPAGKETTIVISGDHLVMRNIVPGGETVQNILEHKPRLNILTFILNGTEKGSVKEICWPVDLAPVILHQMGVEHNFKFPAGVNIFTARNAPPRRKLSGTEYMARIKGKQGEKNKREEVLSRKISVSGSAERPILKIGKTRIKLEAMPDNTGFGVEFHAGLGMPTAWRFNATRRMNKLFCSVPSDRDLFYIIAANKRSPLQALINPRDFRRCMLAVILNGWYKFDRAKEMDDLEIDDLDAPQPKIADAEIDCSNNIIRLKGNGWRFPLFSKNDAVFPRCIIAAYSDKSGYENILRMPLDDGESVKKLQKMLIEKPELTVIMPPDSFLHKESGVPENAYSSIIRLVKTTQGKKLELVSSRAESEGYIKKLAPGNYAYKREKMSDLLSRFTGEAPAEDFTGSWNHVIKISFKGSGVVLEKSFTETDEAVKLFLNPSPDEHTILICGRESDFLKTFYPDLAGKSVLFSIAFGKIRHAVQYSNGDFRLPEVWDPVDKNAAVSAKLAHGALIIRWGDASWAMPENKFMEKFDDGREFAIKVPHCMPTAFTFFEISNPQWLTDISKDGVSDFMVLCKGTSPFINALSLPVKKRYFMGVNTGSGWKYFWNDRIEFFHPANRK